MPLNSGRLNSPYERLIENPPEGASPHIGAQDAHSRHGALTGSHDYVPTTPAYSAAASPSGWGTRVPAEYVDPGAYTVAPGYDSCPLPPDQGWPGASAGRHPGSSGSGSPSSDDDVGAGSTATTSPLSRTQRSSSSSKKIGRREATYWVMGLAIVCLLSASALTFTVLMRFTEGKSDRSSERGLQFDTKVPASGESGFKFEVEYRPSGRDEKGDSPSTRIRWAGRTPPFFTPTIRYRSSHQYPFTWLSIRTPEVENATAGTASGESPPAIPNTTAGDMMTSSSGDSTFSSSEASAGKLTDSSTLLSNDSTAGSSAESSNESTDGSSADSSNDSTAEGTLESSGEGSTVSSSEILTEGSTIEDKPDQARMLKPLDTAGAAWIPDRRGYDSEVGGSPKVRQPISRSQGASLSAAIVSAARMSNSTMRQARKTDSAAHF